MKNSKLKENKNKTMDIVMPWRIGDCLLVVPALLTLKELLKTDDKGIDDVRLLCGSLMESYIESLGIFRTEIFSNKVKYKSWLFPSDMAIFYFASSKIYGLRAKKTYGQSSKKRIYMRYSVNIPYLRQRKTDLFPDEELLKYFKDKYKFSNVIINNFGICLALGYTSEQIKTALERGMQSIRPEIKASDYFVCCMEAGYGKTSCANRRWEPENYIQLAKKIYSEYGYRTLFIGLDNSFEIPQISYMSDERGAKNIEELAEIISNSLGYYGNDTGPLHLANFLGKYTLGIYAYKAPPEMYGPIYAKRNYPMIEPLGVEPVFNTLKLMIKNINP